MFRDIDADCYIMVDGDDTYGVEVASEIEKLVLSGKADMVIGNRLAGKYFEENKRRLDWLENTLKKINVVFTTLVINWFVRLSTFYLRVILEI